MAEEIRSVGLASIKWSPIAVDGGMGTTMSALGLTYQDTSRFYTEDGQSTELYAEEEDDPIEAFETQGLTKVDLSIMNYSPHNLARIFGGTVTGAGATAKWNSPDVTPNVELSCEIITKTGLKIEIPRCRVTAKFNGEFRKRGLLLINISAKILKPTKVGLSRVMISKAA